MSPCKDELLKSLMYLVPLVACSMELHAVLSVKFEVGVSLLLAPAGADKRGPKAPFPQVENAEYNRQFAREFPLELRREPGLTESTVHVVTYH